MLEKIQIFTRGCVRSIVVAKNLNKAVEKMGLNIEVEKIEDPEIHKQEGIMGTPSVKINGELKVDGEFTSPEEFEEILSEYLQYTNII